MTTLDLAKSWLEQDPDPVTRAELEALIPAAESGDAAAMDALRDRFDTRLTFGTAGLRGELGAGSNRMNRVLVSQAATGFARWLLARDENASVVIGYDGRVNSDVFARDSAELMAGAGLRVVQLPRALPTTTHPRWRRPGRPAGRQSPIARSASVAARAGSPPTCAHRALPRL